MRLLMDYFTGFSYMEFHSPVPYKGLHILIYLISVSKNNMYSRNHSEVRVPLPDY